MNSPRAAIPNAIHGGIALVEYFPAGRYAFTAQSGGSEARSVVSVSGPSSVELVLKGGTGPSQVTGTQAAAAVVVVAVAAVAALSWRRRALRARQGP